MERDEESGLCYHGARYYTPWLGKWISADPLGIAGGINLYEYGGSRPMALTDRTGMQPKPEDTPKTSTDDDSKAPVPTGNAALGVKDAVHRAGYKSQIKANSEKGVKKVREALGAGDAKKAADIAKATSAERNKIRLDTRAKTTPAGKAFAEAFDTPRLWDDIVRKYGDPYANPAVAERIAFSAGKSSPRFNILSRAFGLASGAGLVWGLSISYRRIRDAPAGQKGLVVMEEGGGLLGSGAGSWYGGGWGVSVAAWLGLGPLGTLVLAGGGSIGGGLLGDKLGRFAARGVHGLRAVVAMPTMFYQLTHMGMYLDHIGGPPELIEGEPHTLDYYRHEQRVLDYYERRAREQRELEEEIKNSKPYKPPVPLYELEPGTPWNGLPLGRNWTDMPPS
jgi:RHS repeat-associated protein